MKPSCPSLNKIYGDPQLQTTSNRIKFLNHKWQRLAIAFPQVPSPDPPTCLPKSTRKALNQVQTNSALEVGSERKEHTRPSSSHNEKQTELKEWKRRNYQVSKLNS